MLSTFQIYARQYWSFQLVLLGNLLQLGWCRDAAVREEEALTCSTLLRAPHYTPHNLAGWLMIHPGCCL